MDAGVEGTDRAAAAAAGDSGNTVAALAEPDVVADFRTAKGVDATDADAADEDEDEEGDKAAAAGEAVTMERCVAATGDRANAIGVMAGGGTKSGRAGEAAAFVDESGNSI